ncbi:hypothetical protein CDAR_39751 [Caerostris darwini]|uniref:Uncharacterized protein n=1 Tax=Caerostris darwini TaxID=1538125 RepID=A0AAV4U6W7_9ARAC|nr:hypothetical protein CDAR_39751 [Caerostris darwini]
MAEEEDTFSLNLFAPAIHPLRRDNYLLLSSAQRISSCNSSATAKSHIAKTPYRLHGYKYETFLHHHKKLTGVIGFPPQTRCPLFHIPAIQPNYIQTQ